MSSVLCKIWRFFSNILSAIVGFTAESLKTIGSAAVDVLAELFKEAGDALGSIFSSSPLVWVALGIGAVLLFGKDKDDDNGGKHNATEL